MSERVNEETFAIPCPCSMQVRHDPHFYISFIAGGPPGPIPSLPCICPGVGCAMTLTEFLMARIAEDESEAHWIHSDDCDHHRPPGFPCDCAYGERRIKAECEAKRRIVDLHTPGSFTSVVANGDAIEASVCWTCSYLWDDERPRHIGVVSDRERVEEKYPCETLRLLALPYADHPDYDEAWRP